MFWYTIIKESDLARTYEIRDLQRERIMKQQKAIEELVKDIPRWWWYLWNFDKRKKDSQLKKQLPDWITIEQVEDIVIDRKQHKIAILLK